MERLYEDDRGALISRGKSGKKEKDGKSRYEKRVKSHLASSVKEFNQINMQEFFGDGILTVNIPVRGETDNYAVKIKVGGILDLIRKEIGPSGEVDLNTILRALTRALNDEDVYVSCSCLHPDTRIRLMDDTSPTIAEMKDRYDNGEPLYVHSMGDDDNLTWGEVENVWIAEETSDFTKITLDNDEEILTTPDHLYLRSDGIYIPAKDLSVGDVLTFNHVVAATEKVYFGDPVPVYDIKVEGYPNFLVDAGVILHNCPDWKYRGHYWASIREINSDEPENRPSDITNPHDTLGPGCKHIMLVLSNYRWIVKVANVIWNYIKYMKANRQREYARIIYPALYNKEYEGPVQLTMDDTDELDNSEETINTANETSRRSGQFKAGNPYRYQRKERSGGEQVPMEGSE